MERMTSLRFITKDADSLNLWVLDLKKKKKKLFCKNDVGLKRLQKELAKAGNSGYLPKTNPNCANRHTLERIGAGTARWGEFRTITRLINNISLRRQASALGVHTAPDALG